MIEKAEIIKSVCDLLVQGETQKCISLAKAEYPYLSIEKNLRSYSKYQMSKIYLRDGFIDRYSGKKLLFPGIIRILTLEFPDIFKYHSHWKMSETHSIYWELFPTIDHIVPVTRGGKDNDENWITTSMLKNSAKSNWTVEEMNWEIHPKGVLSDWDGLINIFLDIIKENSKFEKDAYVKQWIMALTKALNN